MVGLAIVGFCLALLYQWLVGNWFARVLMTPLLWVIFWFILTSFGVGGPIGGNTHEGFAAVLFVATIPAAWFVAGIPFCVRKQSDAPFTESRALSRRVLESAGVEHPIRRLGNPS